MALILDNIQPDTPQTHVLIIGVGGYRYLSGGAEQKQHTIESIGLLKQLSSPPKSALAFRKFITETADRWKAPLGSIEFLLSPSPDDPDPSGENENFEPATIHNITQAYGRWKNRCNSLEENMAIFFFCGHGLEKEEHFLLAEDFGEDSNNPWRGGFSFNKTRRAFHSCKAQTQCFFIDACRQITSGILQQDLPSIPLDVPNFSSSDCLYNLTVKAAAHNEQAYGPRKEPSYFTQALTKAFQGALAKNINNRWVIETGRIASEITHLIGSINSSQDYRQRTTSDITTSTSIFEVSGTPNVEVTIDCLPSEANKFAKLSCQNLLEDIMLENHSDEHPWTINVKAGIYKVFAKFEPPSYQDTSEIFRADPPRETKNVHCQNI